MPGTAAPYHLDVNEHWQSTECAVLGMGKLGGKELNYSSDVDLLLVYSDEGGVFKEPPRKGARPSPLKNHQPAKALRQGFCCRIDPAGPGRRALSHRLAFAPGRRQRPARTLARRL